MLSFFFSLLLNCSTKKKNDFCSYFDNVRLRLDGARIAADASEKLAVGRQPVRERGRDKRVAVGLEHEIVVIEKCAALVGEKVERPRIRIFDVKGRQRRVALFKDNDDAPTRLVYSRR